MSSGLGQAVGRGGRGVEWQGDMPDKGTCIHVQSLERLELKGQR